jgi:Flp pilus assembly protein TadB
VISLAVASGLLIIGGLFLAGDGLRLVPIAPPRQRSNRRRNIQPPTPEAAGVIAAAAVVTLLITRWPVAALSVGVAVWFAQSSALRQQNQGADIADALTTWAEMLRDATGTPRGIEGVLVATAGGAPLSIRPHVARLARRLPYEPLEVALDGLADDLDHPIGDLVVTALRLAARSGGRQIRAVLDDLAKTAREEAQMQRRVEVARARPRADMRTVLFIMAGFILLFVVAARDYLQPYSTVTGQMMLMIIVGVWCAGVAAMARLGRARPIERFLLNQPPAGASGPEGGQA